jgi:hypothetical protein
MKIIKSFFFTIFILYMLFCLLNTTISCLWFSKHLVIKPLETNPDFIWHPYFISTQKPNTRITKDGYPGASDGRLIWSQNAQGCRDSVDYKIEKNPNTIRWICLGGSASVTGSKDELTIPNLAAKLVKENSNNNFQNIEMYNFGRVGWDSTQELMLLSTELRAYQPDYLLFYDGRNDAFFASMPKYRPFWNTWAYEVDRTLNEQSFFKELFFPFWRGWTKLSEIRNPEDTALKKAHYLFQDKQTHQWDFYVAHPEVADCYEGNLKTMLVLAAGLKCKGAVLALQPQIFWCDKKRSSEESTSDQKFQPSWKKAMLQLYPLIATAHSRAAQEKNLSISEIDLNTVFKTRTDQMFVDDCHLSDEGNLVSAQAIAPKMMELMKATQPNPPH